VNGSPTSFDTQSLKLLFGIRKRQAGKMELNTHFNRLLGCPLSLHKFQVNPFGITAEAVEFGH
jgi:hypothetical protein